MNRCRFSPFSFPFFFLLSLSFIPVSSWSLDNAPADLEPGSLRLSNELSLEGVFHHVHPGWQVQDDKLNKTFSKTGEEKNPWTSTWGQRLLTEVAARATPDISGRLLLEAQGEYADRYWRPINYDHYQKKGGHDVFLRQAEGRIDKSYGYLHGFSGVGHGDWQGKGDFFALYPGAIGDSDYLGASSFLGVYPTRWNQNLFFNMSKRRVPQGAEGGVELWGMEAAAAYGNELAWGYNHSAFGRLSAPIKSSKLTFVYKNDDVPYQTIQRRNDRKEAYALSWDIPFEAGHRIQTGVLYQPYLAGRTYTIDRNASDGAGLQGSSHLLSDKTAVKEDGLGERLKIELRPVFFDRLWIGSVDLTHLGILAGNKEQIDLLVGTDISQDFRFDTQYTARRPIEGPLPFLYEGTADNMGAMISLPRGPESPFNVDWTNRKATFLTFSLWYDPTPGSRMFLYDPHTFESWNLNPEESSLLTLGLQFRIKDYPTSTDRQYYYSSSGDIVWEPAGHAGAWATKKPLQEARILGRGKRGTLGWMLSVAVGEALAQSGLSYSLDASKNKPISDYYSIEGRVDYWPVSFWSHFGSGVWGPDGNISPFWGEAFDRIWGAGVSYNITRNTTWDIGYIAVRQDDNLFVAPDLGSYDEIRTVFSHRFGFQFQFQEP